MQQSALGRRSFPPISLCAVADSTNSPGSMAAKTQGRLPGRAWKLHRGVAFCAGRFRLSCSSVVSALSVSSVSSVSSSSSSRRRLREVSELARDKLPPMSQPRLEFGIETLRARVAPGASSVIRFSSSHSNAGPVSLEYTFRLDVFYYKLGETNLKAKVKSRKLSSAPQLEISELSIGTGRSKRGLASGPPSVAQPNISETPHEP